jgi:hypothetical protein
VLDWEKYISIADKFQAKAKREDKEDLKHTIILRLAQKYYCSRCPFRKPDYCKLIATLTLC